MIPLDDKAVRPPTLRESWSSAYRSARMRLRPVAQRFWIPGLGDRLKSPVFILGSTRSGKTVLKDLLAAHPAITAYPGEANHLWHPNTHVWRYSRHRSEVPPFWVDPAYHTARSLELRHARHGDHVRTVFGVFAWREGVDVFLNESAKLTFMTSYITSLFPDARFINVVRDGRCVAFAQATKLAREIDRWRWLYSKHGFALSFHDLLATCAQSWQAHVEEAERVAFGGSGIPTDRIHTVYYERLCATPVPQVRGLCRFLGLDPSRLPDPLPVGVSNHNEDLEETMDGASRRQLRGLLGPTLTAHGYL